MVRTRWAAIGAAVAVTLGAGGIGLVDAAKGSGERAVYSAITACRVTDTRPASAVGPKSSPLGPGEIHTISVRGTNGECTGIPSDAIAVALNVTAVGATLPTFLTIWPDGARPNASSLNPQPGAPPTPNAVTTDLSGAGSFDVYNRQGNVHLIVDIVGYYQDHHHDDRYYRKSETARTWWASVTPQGGVRAGSSGVTVEKLEVFGDGRYSVAFPIDAGSDVVNCAITATPNSVVVGFPRVTAAADFGTVATDDVFVYIENGSGSGADANFSIVVNC